MAGSAVKNLRMFSALCDPDAMKKAMVVTTMWGETTREIGLQRERELKTIFLPEMMAAGCRVKPFHNTYESAWNIIRDLEVDRTSGDQQRAGDQRQTGVQQRPGDRRQAGNQQRPGDQQRGRDQGQTEAQQRPGDQQRERDQRQTGVQQRPGDQQLPGNPQLADDEQRTGDRRQPRDQRRAEDLQRRTEGVKDGWRREGKKAKPVKCVIQ
jgi:hypothetical protein